VGVAMNRFVVLALIQTRETMHVLPPQFRATHADSLRERARPSGDELSERA